MSERGKAIQVRGLSKRYGRSGKAHLVLNQLDMTVEKGTIYGLLGASGCGKTTLLSCIVGRRSITSGEIWVLGGKPGSKESGVPGPRLGYMPQEIALMRQFSIKDALNHFGWIYGMDNEEIDNRAEFLKNLLELPALETQIKNLSGGQERRVSLAVALVQDPELIILDEPTVGLDPVLRQKIWDYLLDSVTNYNKTVIITTHYIEEAKQAHKIGLMRNGKLLAEDTPQKLLQLHNCMGLEQVFLKLSDQQGKLSNEVGSFENTPNSEASSNCLPHSSHFEGVDVAGSGSVPESELRKELDKSLAVPETRANFPKNISHQSTRKFSSTAKGHAKALLSKNWYRITRHPGAIVFVFLFPMLELCSFYLAVGGQPQGLKLGVVNEELGNFTTCKELKNSLGSRYGGEQIYKEEGNAYCIIEGLSCKYLDMINDDMVIKTPFPDLISALNDAKEGKLLAVIHFTHNFSKAFEHRLEFGGDTPDDILNESQISVWMDMSRRQSALLLERRLLKLQQDVVNEIFDECKIPEKIGKVPVHFYKPVYGSFHSTYNQYMTPGVVTTMIFFLAVSVTATIMIVERLDGIWDRTLLAGVSSTEILISHIVLEAGVICLQVVEVIIFVFFIFGMPCAGRYFDIVILLLLQGFCGMCGGFLVSVSCSSVTASNFVSMGSFYPILIFSGLLWPIEGMPGILKRIAVGMPTTLSTLSMRNIMEKGWTLTHIYVYEGYLISILWIFIFSSLSILVVRIRK
ncbi:hypothetical protein RUM43_012597 [Polyplax serrata]|uniref:Uncharacterized protein n=1 Tax=Polyplax serrata TaxID=468196 RepID=A0AAN8P5U4_POLSC